MKAVGKVAGAVILLVGFAVVLLLLFNSMQTAREQGLARAPTPVASPTATVATPGPVSTPTMQASGYISRVVVSAAVSSGPGEIGIWAPEGRMPSGPQAFALDKDSNIYITDNVNRRINKYSPQGKFSSSIPLPDRIRPEDLAEATSMPLANLNRIVPEDLAIDAKGDIYVLSGYTPYVLKLNPQGALVRVYVTSQWAEGEAIGFLPDGTLALQDNGANVHRLGTTEGRFPSSERGIAGKGMLYRDGVLKSCTFPLGPDGRSGVLECILAGGKALTLTVSLPAAIPGPIGKSGAERPGQWGAGFYNVDAQGNYYVVATISYDVVPLKMDTWILRYDVTGQLKAFLQSFPPAPYTIPSAFARLRIAPNGDVYKLYPFRDQVQVIRWEYRP